MLVNQLQSFLLDFISYFFLLLIDKKPAVGKVFESLEICSGQCCSF